MTRRLNERTVLELATRSQREGRGRPRHLEHDAQVAFFQLVDAHPRYRDLLICAMPNAGGYRGGFASNAVRASRMKAEGVRRGPPDIYVDEPRGGYHGLRLELKIRPNRPSPEQRAWIAALEARGYRAQVVYSTAEAWQALETYLNATPTPSDTP